MTALRVLTAIAERGSTAAAADSIHLSQSAVSKQLLTVEDLLGAKLFHRLPTGMVPTDLGQIYIAQARVAIAAMQEAAFQAANLKADPNILRLKVLPIFGDRWLLPRFEDFSQQYPHIEVRYTTHSADASNEQPDGVFMFGRAPASGVDALYLFGRDVRLICTPGYWTRLDKSETLDALARGTIFEHPGTPLFWSDLVESNGRPGLVPRRATRFEYYTLVLRAALSGQGLALVPLELVAAELASGELVNPGCLGYECDLGYWFTIPDDRVRSPALKVFRGWLESRLVPNTAN